MAVSTSTIVVHDGYDHPEGMPCRECRIILDKGIKPKTKKAAKPKR